MTQLNDNKLSAEAYAVQAGGEIDPVTGAVVPGIEITTTFERAPDNSYPLGSVYGRPDNATVRQAESVICALEGASHAMLFGSGMAAAVSAFLGLKRPAHIIAPTVMYWVMRNWLANDAASHGLSVTFVDMTDLDKVRQAVRPGETAMIWAETPGNPIWNVCDIAALAEIAHAADALLGVDSTVATPVLTQPLALGADLVMHAATKYLNGHSDVVAGALAFASDNDYAQRVRAVRSSHGGILGPFEAAMLLRGMRTLYVRVERQCESALALAEHLSKHGAVSEILYPGLPGHPQYALAAKQMKGGFSGMLSVRLAAGEQAAIDVAARLQLFKRATSLGGVESLVEHRASIEGAGSPCPPDLLRVSVGLEPINEMIADWDQALS